jgi:hypothetical protein
MTTYTEFITGLSGMGVAGVARYLAYPPASINASDLPLLFIQLPRGEDGAITFDGGVTWPKLRAEVVVVIEPVGQARSPESFAACLTMMDSLSAALAAAQNITKSKLTWSIRQDGVEVAGNTYWAVVAEVEGKG